MKTQLLLKQIKNKLMFKKFDYITFLIILTLQTLSFSCNHYKENTRSSMIENSYDNQKDNKVFFDLYEINHEFDFFKKTIDSIIKRNKLKAEEKKYRKWILYSSSKVILTHSNIRYGLYQDIRDFKKSKPGVIISTVDNDTVEIFIAAHTIKPLMKFKVIKPVKQKWSVVNENLYPRDDGFILIDDSDPIWIFDEHLKFKDYFEHSN